MRHNEDYFNSSKNKLRHTLSTCFLISFLCVFGESLYPRTTKDLQQMGTWPIEGSIVMDRYLQTANEIDYLNSLPCEWYVTDDFEIAGTQYCALWQDGYWTRNFYLVPKANCEGFPQILLVCEENVACETSMLYEIDEYLGTIVINYYESNVCYRECAYDEYQAIDIESQLPVRSSSYNIPGCFDLSESVEAKDCKRDCNTPMPASMPNLMQIAKQESMDNEIVYQYIRQDKASDVGASFTRLLDCKFDSIPILIYMKEAGGTTEIYACSQPFSMRYPSTLLLARISEEHNIMDWYEIRNGIISTFRICNFWENAYVARQDFVIKNGRFHRIGSYKEYDINGALLRSLGKYNEDCLLRRLHD